MCVDGSHHPVIRSSSKERDERELPLVRLLVSDSLHHDSAFAIVFSPLSTYVYPPIQKTFQISLLLPSIDEEGTLKKRV